MTYDDQPTPANLGRSPQGQRCASCGHTEPDRWARFCGVCGGTLGAGGAALAGGGVAPGPTPGREPPVRYGTVAPASQPYAAVPAQQAAQVSQVDHAQSVLYTVPSVGFGGPARLGAAVAAGFTLLPSVLFAFLGAWLVHWGRDTLNSWQTAVVQVPVPLVNVSLGMNFIDLLHMRRVFDILIYWDDRLWLTFVILWLVPWVVWILAGAFFGVLLATIYNTMGKMGGGMRVTMVPAASPGQPYAQSTAWSSSPPAAWSGPPQQRR
jgi:hypothetical protein